MLKVGMFTSGYQRNPLEHCFMDAKEYGYDYIEPVSYTHLDVYKRQYWNRLCKPL